MSFPTREEIMQAAIEKLQQLPYRQQQEALDYLEFLAQKYGAKKSTKPRIAGLHKGKVWIGDDFNDPIPPEYWSEKL